MKAELIPCLQICPFVLQMGKSIDVTGLAVSFIFIQYHTNESKIFHVNAWKQTLVMSKQSKCQRMLVTLTVDSGATVLMLAPMMRKQWWSDGPCLRMSQSSDTARYWKLLCFFPSTHLQSDNGQTRFRMSLRKQ